MTFAHIFLPTLYLLAISETGARYISYFSNLSSLFICSYLCHIPVLPVSTIFIINSLKFLDLTDVEVKRDCHIASSFKMKLLCLFA